MIGSLLNFTFFILLWQPLGLSKHWLQKALQSRWSVTGDHLMTILPVHSWDFPGSHHSVFTGDVLYRNLFRSDSKSQIAVSVILCYGDARLQGADRRSLFNKGIYYSISLGYKNIGRVEEASSRLRDQKWSADHRTELVTSTVGVPAEMRRMPCQLGSCHHGCCSRAMVVGPTPAERCFIQGVSAHFPRSKVVSQTQEDMHQLVEPKSYRNSLCKFTWEM